MFYYVIRMNWQEFVAQPLEKMCPYLVIYKNNVQNWSLSIKFYDHMSQKYFIKLLFIAQLFDILNKKIEIRIKRNTFICQMNLFHSVPVLVNKICWSSQNVEDVNSNVISNIVTTFIEQIFVIFFRLFVFVF